MLLARLRNRDNLVVFVPLAQNAVDAQQLEVLLAEGFYALHRMDLAHLSLRGLLVALHHALVRLTLIIRRVEHHGIRLFEAALLSCRCRVALPRRLVDALLGASMSELGLGVASCPC